MTLVNKRLLVEGVPELKVMGSAHCHSEISHTLRVQAQRLAGYTDNPEEFLHRCNKIGDGHQFTLKHIDRLVRDVREVIPLIQTEIKMHQNILERDEVPHNPWVVGDQRTQVEHCLQARIEKEEDAHDLLGLLLKLYRRWELVEYAVHAEIPQGGE